MNVIADIHVTPIGTETPSLSDYVAAAEAVLQRYPNIKSQLNPMTTTLEGDLDTILQVLRDMHEAPFARGAQRVSTTIRIDERRDKPQPGMQDRVASVQKKLDSVK